ncbi:hypothetical protein [Labrenzia sp. VG12]|uniref:hypothetical protein n=1 Tax=Labrenzia sp. VG12 TaxID=2021862 RepID=UPI000B8BC228|nr:hypothetical protein [Labrenzia sp. VG12]ASP33422.1 hypothetical protein CHH27_09340 [Labrenzia sp. VG12]
MSFQSKSILKTVAVTLLCGLLAACQTTGLKPGSIQTNYAPAGWTKKTSNGFTGYVCHAPRCKSDRLIAHGPVKVSGDMEKAIKDGVLSRELFNAIANVYNIASKDQEKITITRRVVKKDYAGFDFTAYFKDREGRIWMTGRFIIQDNRGSVLVAASRSRSVANTYFKRYLSNTTIKRLP